MLCVCVLLFTNPFTSTTLFKHYNNSLRRYDYYLPSCLLRTLRFKGTKWSPVWNLDLPA